jgi:hypothetical protein
MRGEGSKDEVRWTSEEEYVLREFIKRRENFFKIEQRTGDLIAAAERRTWWSGLSDRTKGFLGLIAKIAGTVLATLGILEFWNRHHP